jgi:hypothetical protein
MEDAILNCKKKFQKFFQPFFKAHPITQFAVILYSILIFFSCIILYFHQNTFFPLVYIQGTIAFWLQILWGGIVAGAFIGISLICHTFSVWFREVEREFQSILGRISIKQAFFIALFSSVGEELFFRGALQPILGLWIVSIIFGMLHFPTSRNLFFYPFMACFMGFIFGFLFLKSGNSLVAPVTSHFLINFIGIYRMGSFHDDKT